MKYDDIQKLVAASDIAHAKVRDEGYRVRVSLGQLELDIYEADDAEAKLKKFVAWIWKMNAAAITSPMGHVDPTLGEQRKAAELNRLRLSIANYEKEFGEAFGGNDE